MLIPGYWSEPLMDRQHTRVFFPTLDSMIDEDDPVRLVDEVLTQLDWSDWEAEYNGHRGQPPIHPRYVAGAIMYGMYRGIRSSRKLEEACHYRFDFIWLVEGHHIDHTTFAKFRTKMEARDVEFYAPAQSSEPQPGDAAYREDPTQPVPESLRSDLNCNNRGQLDKSNFIYSSEEDQYYCPRGHAMPFEKTKPTDRSGVRTQRRVYRCPACGGCPLAEKCLAADSKGKRTITRDAFAEVRERTAIRMSTPEARALYNRRPQIAETPFGILKAVMGIRQFLLRGLDKVKTEWMWAVTAFNLMKLARAIAIMRAECSP